MLNEFYPGDKLRINIRRLSRRELADYSKWGQLADGAAESDDSQVWVDYNKHKEEHPVMRAKWRVHFQADKKGLIMRK